MAGSGSTKSSEGIHLVESTNTEKAYTANVIEAILPNRIYKLTITVKDSTLNSIFVLRNDLTTGYIGIPTTVGTHEIIFSTKSDISNKILHFYLFDNNEGSNIDFTVDSLVEVKSAYSSTPKILFTFDDGWNTQYTRAFNYMNSKNMSGTIYVIPDVVDTKGKVTKSQLDEMYSSGWCLANHTIDHSYMRSFNRETAKTKIQQGMNWLKANGYETGVYHLAYNGGKYNDDVINACKELGIKTGRTIEACQNESVIPDLYKLKTLICGGGSYDLGSIKSAIDTAISQNKICILMFHRIVDIQEEVGTVGMNFLCSDF